MTGMLPVARTEKLHVEQLPDELIVYDTARQKAHCLSPAAASVWRNCNGQRTAEDISVQLQKEGIGADKEMVWMILHRLSKLNLLVERIVLPEDAILSSRRDLIKKVAVAGGMLAVLTATIAAPTVARASSGGSGTIGLLSDRKFKVSA
jgi:hypothetical protein